MLRALHRCLGLSLALLWLIQATSGVALVFRWEIDDALVAGPRGGADPIALGARIEALERHGDVVSSMWASDVAADRFDIYYADAAGGQRVMRVSGAGQTLRDVAADEVISADGIFNVLASLHESLFAGTLGAWILGVSSAYLFANLILGMYLAWPRRGAWRRALFPGRSGSLAARRHAWHRMLGLWVAIPVLVVVGTGVLLELKDNLPRLSSTDVAPVAAPAPARRGLATQALRIGPGDAIARALRRYPGSTLSGLSMSHGADPWYRIRVRRTHELPQIIGATTLLVSRADGRVLEPPMPQPVWLQRLLDAAYPLHTGQAGGLAGRIVVLLLGVALSALSVLGFGAWHARRKRRTREAGAARAPQQAS